MADQFSTQAIVEQRRTHKVIGDVSEMPVDQGINRNQIDRLLQAAGNAPVHYACDRLHQSDLTSPVPWRAYKLELADCQKLKQFLIENDDTTKVPNMLAAANFLVQVTWLPDAGTIKNSNASKDEVCFDGTLRNMEHIAAASAFIQSILLLGEELGFKTYWSSGGPLRSNQTFEELGISTNELLLGSIFLFPADTGVGEVKPGSMANKRGELDEWSKWVS